MSTTQEPYVFVSYAHENVPFVQRLMYDLKMRGINAWVDKSGLVAGEPDWESALRVAISGAKAVILIASPDSRASRYVKDELRIAELYKRRIYPVWVAGGQWMDSIPVGLGGTQYIDARGPRYPVAVNELVSALSGPPPLTVQAPIPPSSNSSMYQQAVRSTPYQAAGSPPLTKKSDSGKVALACLIPAVATIVVVIVLAILVIGPLINYISGLNQNTTPPPPGSPILSGSPTLQGSPTQSAPQESGQLHVTPRSLNLIHTEGYTGSCFYFSGSGWDCRVTLQNISPTGAFNWSTQVSNDTITLSPSAAIVPVSAGQSETVSIHIPDSSCGHAVVTFKGPDNSVDVTIDCS